MLTDEALEKLGLTITEALTGAVGGFTVVRGELTVTANAGDIVAVIRFLREDPRCQFFSIIDVTAVDWPGRERRFRTAEADELANLPAAGCRLPRRRKLLLRFLHEREDRVTALGVAYRPIGRAV